MSLSTKPYTGTECCNLQDDPFFRKYKKLNEALVGIVEDYGLVTFTVLDVQVMLRSILTNSRRSQKRYSDVLFLSTRDITGTFLVAKWK